MPRVVGRERVVVGLVAHVEGRVGLANLEADVGLARSFVGRPRWADSTGTRPGRPRTALGLRARASLGQGTSPMAVDEHEKWGENAVRTPRQKCDHMGQYGRVGGARRVGHARWVVWGDVKGRSRCAAALGSPQREGELGGGVRGKRSPTVI